MKYDKVIDLRTSGYSINEISKKLSISSSSVQRACLNVKMSKVGSRRYYSKVKGVLKPVKVNCLLSEERIRIMSNLLFDGSVYVSNYHYTAMYVNSSLDIVNQFIDDMKKVYGVSCSSFENLQGSKLPYYRIKFISKVIYLDLLKYFITYSTSSKECIIPLDIFESNLKFKIILLRSFWENEGSIAKSGKLSADLKSIAVIEQLSKVYSQMGLKHYISRYWKEGWAYKLILNKACDNYRRFIELELFLDSIVTKGYFVGMKKKDVLQNYFNNKY